MQDPSLDLDMEHVHQDRQASDPLVERTATDHDTGEDPGHPAPSEAAGSSFIANLKRIEALYVAAQIPEMEIMDWTESDIKTRIAYLENLRNLIRSQQDDALASLSTDNQAEAKTLRDANTIMAQEQLAIQLMERIGRDMALYHHFADQSKLNLLDDIHADLELEHELEDRDDDAASGPSLVFPTLDRASLHDTTSPRRPSVASSVTASKLRHAVSRQSIRTNVTIPAVSLLQNDPIFSIPPGPNGIFRWTVFRSLSVALKEQLLQDEPTCFTVGNGLAFGTRVGRIVLFDLSQNLLAVLGDGSMGSVSSLALLPDASLVLAGYQDGFVCLWDVAKKALVKKIEPLPKQIDGKDGHRRGSPIVWVGLHSPEKFYSADLLGTAFYHTILNRVLFSTVYSIRIHGRIHSSPGQPSTTIQSFDPLLKSSIPIFSDPFQLVAITSPIKIAILSMKPTPQIQYRATWASLNHSDKEVDSVVGHSICKWWMPTSRREAAATNTRLLAFSHGPFLSLLSVTGKRSESDPTRKKLVFQISARTHAGPHDIVGIEWLSSSFLLCLTSNQVFKIYDPSTLVCIEEVAVASRHIATTPAWKTDTVFSIPLQAVQHHSLASYYNRLFVMTNDEVCFASLLSWQERLSILIKAGEFRRAFRLALDLYEGETPFVALHMPREPEERQQAVATHLTGLVINLVSMTLSGYDASSAEDTHSYRDYTELA
ncbi:Vacuolar protein sorting-associated protein 8, partial [Kappamyces sp. JEL0680]